jgi:hypothetical protein
MLAKHSLHAVLHDICRPGALSISAAMGANVAGAVENARAVLDAVQALPQPQDAHRPTRN